MNKKNEIITPAAAILMLEICI